MIWAEKIPQHYKRTCEDAAKKCPYCTAQWNWSLDRDLEYYRSRKVTITCKKCKKTFIWSGKHI